MVRVKSMQAAGVIKKLPTAFWMILFITLFFSLVDPSYFRLSNFNSVLIQSIPLMILAFGQTLIILTQGTDLSLGAQVSFVTVFWMYLARAGVPMYLAGLLAIATVMVAGMINGIVVAKGKIQPFIATLGMQNILYSLSLLLTSGASIYYYHEIFIKISEGTLFGIRNIIWVLIIVFSFTWIVLRKTRFGTSITAIGGNAEALTLAGQNADRSLIKTYVFAAFLAGISGIITASRVESGQPVVAMGWEFDAVAASLLGGASLRKGKGGVVGTIFGVLLIQTLKNGLNILGIASIYHNAFIGSLVLLSIILDSIVQDN